MEQAKGELVPGGLAMVIGSVHEDSPHVGIIVSLIKSFDHNLGKAWQIEPLEEDPEKESVLAIHLMPINPEADPLETTKERDLCLNA